MSKVEKLAEINEHWVRNCTCALRESATQAVVGNGSADARILLVGEAPGKSEDIEGKPFVGAAGKFLNEMLASVKLSREDVYITNVVKYRPPENRDPLPEEVAACAEWLKDEINIVDPTLIVLLGRYALERFFPGEKISRAHGTLLKKEVFGLNTRNFYALYHPAAALYNGSLRAVLLEDFKKIPHVLKKLN